MQLLRHRPVLSSRGFWSSTRKVPECANVSAGVCGTELHQRDYSAPDDLFTWGNSIHAHVGAEGFGNDDAAVSLLIVFHDCDPRASDREPRSVERVHEF